MDAARAWTEGLATWAIPPGILASAPESPYGFSVDLFSRHADEAMGEDTPTRRRALESLPEGGAVLDVGCGAGAASLPLAPRARRVVGVDESAGMLRAFAERAGALGLDHAEVEGRWPDVAGDVEAADVVVCAHVFYNVQDLVPFASALGDRARRGIVVEMTSEHPRAWMSPLWRDLHGVERPARPTADDALSVLEGMGVRARAERWERPLLVGSPSGMEVAAFVRRALCVPAERDPEIRRALERHPMPERRTVVTLWWEGSAS